jgi:hypothetical protein
MNYVDELREEGQLDSLGSFTFDLARSQAVLYRNTFAEPAMYVLKLIQGLVVANPTSIEVTASARHLELVAVGADYRQEELEQALADGPVHAREGLRELVLGLGSALAQGHRVDVQHGPRFRIRIDLVAKSNREVALVKERCRCCPVSLTVNGKPLLEGPWCGSHRLLERIVVEGPTRLALRPQIEAEVIDYESSPWFYFTVPLYRRELVLEGRARVLAGGRGEPAVLCSSATTLSTDLRGPCWLHLVKHGVLLEREPLPLEFGSEVLLSADHLPVDASGFKAMQLTETIAQACELLSVAAASIRPEVKRIEKLTHRPADPVPVRWVRTLASAVTFFLKTMFSLPVLLLLSLALVGSSIWLVPFFVIAVLFLPTLLKRTRRREPAESLHWKVDTLLQRLYDLEQEAAVGVGKPLE